MKSNDHPYKRLLAKQRVHGLQDQKKHVTEYHKTPDKVYHNFSVLIGTSNISNPVLQIKVGDDMSVAQRVQAVIGAILANQRIKINPILEVL